MIRPLTLLLATLATPAFAGPFSVGGLAVFQTSNAGSNITASIVEVNPNTAGQTPSNIIAIDGTTTPNELRFSGSATSTGYLSNSADRTLLTFTGANSTNTSANVNTLLPRGVGTLDRTGAFSLKTTYTGTSGNQTRSATSLDNSTWFIADQGGIYTNGATAASPSGNVRGIKTFGGIAYVGQASSTTTTLAVSTVSAATGGTITGLPGLTNNANIQDFYLIASGNNGATFDVLYTLSATGNTAGTIAKFSLVSGSWVANGTYTTTFGGFGLTAADNADGALLYVTTGQGALAANSVLKLADTAGYNSTIAITTANNVTLYTAPAATTVKGVAFAPEPAVADVNLSNYVRVGKYSLPPRPSPERGDGNLLADEASGVAYNWDTDTLFIVGDGGRSVTQVSKTGVLIDTMTLPAGSSPQGTEFYDPEGITYIGGGQFVFSEERYSNLVKFTYAGGTTLTRAQTQNVQVGLTNNNEGIEGLSWDPQTGGFIGLKEVNPIGIYQTNVNFTAGTATNGSASVSPTNLFNPALMGLADVADVFALSNIPSLYGKADSSHLLVLSQESARIINVDRSGNISSALNITADPGAPLSPAAQQHEGITMDRAGNIYVVSENGAAPELWVYAPSSTPNQAPTAVVLNNPTTSIVENYSTSSAVKVADIAVTDDGLGINNLTVSGADAAFFEITGSALYIRAGTVLDFETKTTYNVTVNVDDTTIGATPDATVDYTLTVTDVANETPTYNSIIVSEVAAWSSGNSAVAADWFELTNTTNNTITISGWKVDDSSHLFSSALDLTGVTSIAPGESVIFIETADLTAARTAFINDWFGGNAPAGLQIGAYTGGGIGLSTSGDEVNVYNAAGVLQASVSFAASDATSPYQTFENGVGVNGAAISQLSAVGVYGAFLASSGTEVGSPGTTGKIFITEVAPWSSGNSPVGSDWFELTNRGARTIDFTGWKVDDNSQSFAAAIAMSGVSSLAPGESAIFLETADLPTTRTTFINTWFGGNAPSGLKVGSYSGASIGLSTGGDQVNVYNSAGVLQASVAFGNSPSAAPFGTFDNTAGIDTVNTPLTILSTAGSNGAFAAANDTNEIGSPGSANASAPAPILSVSVTPGSFSEGAANPAATGTVSRTGDTTNALTVMLSSSDTTEATVPVSVTIAAGQSSASFDVTAVNDAAVDGDQTAIITASAAGTTSGTFNVTVQDDEVTTVPTGLLLTEILSDEASGGVGDYWELTNTSASAIDLSNFKWDDDSLNPNDPAAVTIPAGTTIAAGESIIFTGVSATTFRTWWGLSASVQVISVTSPGLGQNDAIGLFTPSGVKVFDFSYAANKFTRSNGALSIGGHAGASAGGTSTQALVLDPSFGFADPHYTAATVGIGGGIASTISASDIGSPGTTGVGGGGPTYAISVNVTPGSFAESAANPAATGTVTRTGSTASALTVTLASSDVSEAKVPASVTIPAGQASTTFDVTAVNDTYPDGNKTAAISATATGAAPASFNVTVQDDGDVAVSGLILTEILSSESSTAPAGKDDYWELTNTSANAIPLTGYSWHDNGRSGSAALAYALPAGTTVAAGESVIFTAASPAVFRTWWGISNSVQVFQTVGAPGLGKEDGVSLFDGDNEVFFFSYAAGGFTRANGQPSLGGHAGPSAGASADPVALIWVPTSGTTTPRYTFATGSNFGSFQAAVGTDLGSPGTTGILPASVYSFAASTSAVSEIGGAATLTINRTGDLPAATITVNTADDSAHAGQDYTALSAVTVNFAVGETTQNVVIPILDRDGLQGSRTFNVAISQVPEGSTLGTSSSTVTIADAGAVGGILSFASPLITVAPATTNGLPNTVNIALSRTGTLNGEISVVVNASIPTGVPTGQTKLNNTTDYTLANNTATVVFPNGVATQTLSIPIKSTVRYGRFQLSLGATSSGASIGGTVTTLVEVQKKDTNAPTLVVNFGTPNATTGELSLSGTATDSGAISTGINRVELNVINVATPATGTTTALSLTGDAFSQAVQLEHGVNKLTVTAYDNSGKKLAKSQSFTYQNQDIVALAGTYTGLLVPAGTPSNDTSGFLTVTVASSTAVSGKITLGGIAASFSGALNSAGDLYFKSLASTSFPVIDKTEFESYLGSLSIHLANSQAVGTLKTQVNSGTTLAVATAAKNATVADPLLVAAPKYTVSFPSKTQSGLTAEQYPQGDGYAAVAVKANGSVSVTGALADGTAYSASGKLHVVSGNTQSVSLHSLLYKKGGSIAVELVFDLDAGTYADSDVLGANTLWIRPALPRARYYPAGWPTGARIDATGSRYSATVGASVLPGLGTTSPNAQLQFADGGLTSAQTRNFDLSITNAFKNASTDTALKLTINKSTGLFNGVFTHTDATKPAFKGIILQEGANAKGFGFFLSAPTNTLGATGAGGGVTLLPKP